MHLGNTVFEETVICVSLNYIYTIMLEIQLIGIGQ